MTPSDQEQQSLTPGAATSPRRNVSVTLRQGDQGDDSAATLDPANQSLADALRITYNLVLLVMVVLAILFLFSGFQTVKESEKGIRLLFGKRESAVLDPGFRFSFPYPFGELVKVSSGEDRIALDTEFWPFLRDEDRNKPVDQLTRLPSLNPARDGSLITADGAIAHTRWSASYQRVDPAKYAQNVLPDEEAKLVRAAIERGVVHATSRTKIDDLLKQSADDASSLANRAREVAQRTLDNADSGIRIQSLLLVDKMPPVYLFEKFAAVQTATATASKAREEALTIERETLNAVAGGAVYNLRDLISQYETAIEQKDAAKAAELLASIDGTLEGAGGSAGSSETQVAGDVTRIIQGARQYRSEVVNQKQSELSNFQAKLAQFKSNPLVMVHSEWSNALAKFIDHDSLQTVWLPGRTTTLELVLNPDPDIVKTLQRLQRQREGDEARKLREQKQKEAQYKIDTGLKRVPTQ